MTASVLYDAPGPTARLRNRLYAVLCSAALLALTGFVAWRLTAEGQFAPSMWELFQYSGIQQRLADGMVSTLKAFALAALLSLVLGTLLAAGRLSDHAAVRRIATAVVELFRALPLLILVFVLYASLFTPFWALVTGLALYNASVQAEAFRAGVNAVPKGQSEAAYAMGMRKTQVMATVLVPQAVRAMLPTVIGQLVVTLKDTSLGYIITYEELLYAGRLIASNTTTAGGFPYVPVVIVIGALYIAMCLALSGTANWIELRGRRSPKKTSTQPPETDTVAARAG
ncbi:amino acid ABC transporter permease [Streptomyces sp. CA-135486]|uniref:amino acid ABC transporter permease n=1 Tax=Streptomyces sp. CA-135486 TaxID=3240049 RepID=UPI003D946618